MREAVFRTCNYSDLPKVRQFIDELYYTEYGVSEAPSDVKLTLNEFDHHPEKGRIVVFEVDKKIVGYAILVFFWSNEFRADIIDIDEMLVDSDNRNLGLATKFFAWLEVEYPACAGLSLQVGHTNKAQNLYNRQGFQLSSRKHLIKLRKEPVHLSFES